ncbi:hypothetical protein Elgi_37740 [Paenibacillus elgii]|uniref:hypothetical protein n=1 Tax=Paenibacillus elgii TaxID=189691 RepID=UPI002D7A8795|nr:hypothetical protein Elgi_37740 [Paenibacillus elgii]
MRDTYGNKFFLGSTVKPLSGFWNGTEGNVIAMDDDTGNVTVEFEENETCSYFPERLIIV